MKPSASFSERLPSKAYAPSAAYPPAPYARQQFHHPRTSLGAAGHWIHLAAVIAPLLIGEVIKDPDKRWRALRGVSVIAALASEALWTDRLSKDRQKDEDSHAAVEACHDRCR
jgi:hypothetical protein